MILRVRRPGGRVVRNTEERTHLMAAGIVLMILGAWLVAQALGGNLAGRLRVLAAA